MLERLRRALSPQAAREGGPDLSRLAPTDAEGEVAVAGRGRVLKNSEAGRMRPGFEA